MRSLLNRKFFFEMKEDSYIGVMMKIGDETTKPFMLSLTILSYTVSSAIERVARYYSRHDIHEIHLLSLLLATKANVKTL